MHLSLASAASQFIAQNHTGGLVGGALAFIIIGIIGLGSLVLWLWALINAIQNPRLDGNMRLIWVLVIVLVGPIGAIIYLVAGR